MLVRINHHEPTQILIISCIYIFQNAVIDSQ